jgi:hypothetical protein
VDDDILARSERTVRANQAHESSEERNCFYCLEGWVFLGSIGHDGEEAVEAIRCRRCKGTAWIHHLRQELRDKSMNKARLLPELPRG